MLVAQVEVAFEGEHLARAEQLSQMTERLKEECALFGNYSVIFKIPRIIKKGDPDRLIAEFQELFCLDYESAL